MALGDRDYMRGGDSERLRRGPTRGQGEPLSVTNKLIIAVAAVFLMHMLTGRSGVVRQSIVYQALALPADRPLELWRYITSMFCHANPMHLLCCISGLYLFGNDVETRLGGRRMLWIFLLGGALGSIAWMVLNIGQTRPPRLVGSSGGVCALFAATALIAPRLQVMFMPVRKFLALAIGLDLVLLLFPIPIATSAHFGGMLGGYLVARQFAGAQPGTQTRNSRWSFARKRRPQKKKRQQRRGHARGSEPDLRFVDSDDISEDALFSTEVDPILDKIGEFGMDSLTDRERKILDQARQRVKKKLSAAAPVAPTTIFADSLELL